MPAKDGVVVGIDASRMHLEQRTGTENYSDQIIRGLLGEDVNWSWRLYLNTDGITPVLPNMNAEIRPIPAPRFWTHYRLSREILAHRPDLLFVPAHVVPAIHPRTVVTIHDLGYIHHPESHPAGQRRMLDVTTRWSARTAAHIIVPSQQTRLDLLQHYSTRDDKITVIHHGIHPRYRNPDPAKKPVVLEHYRLGKPFVLAVGTIHPRKNLLVLAKAMAESSVSAEYDLVIAGKRGWMSDQVIHELESVGLGPRLRLLDYVRDDDLPALYASAALFVQPSRFEGFGMPVLEAMATGTPVICAAGSSLTEIAGDAAMYFDLTESDSLPHQIDRLLSDTALQAQMRTHALTWSMSFTWERAAAKTRHVLQQALM